MGRGASGLKGGGGGRAFTPTPIHEDKFLPSSMTLRKNPVYYAELKDSDGDTVWTFRGNSKSEVQDMIDYYNKTGNFTKNRRKIAIGADNSLPW